MNENLQHTLNTYSHSGWQSNPAMHQIIDGYSMYHAVLAVAAGFFMLLFLVASIQGWIIFRRTANTHPFKWPFAKKVYFCFATLFTLVALFLALICMANVTNATKPLPGFVGGISSMHTKSYNRQLHVDFNNWIVSGKTTPPNLVQERIHHRQVFHTIRAIEGVVLFAASTFLGIRIWKTLIHERSHVKTKWSRQEVAMLLVGIVTIVIALYAVLVIMANVQSVVVPIVNTLQFG